MDKSTITSLLEEAGANLREAKELFKEYDNCEDMREMEMWSAVIDWLVGKM